MEGKNMKKVDDYIKKRIEKETDFEVKYDLIKQKAKVVKTIIEYRNNHDLSQAELAGFVNQRLKVHQKTA
jgi:hypothetical protein